MGNIPIICRSGNFSAGGSADVAGSTAAGAPVRAGFALADAVVSPLDGDELVCAPPELCRFQFVVLASKRHGVERSNWLGLQPNSWQSQT